MIIIEHIANMATAIVMISLSFSSKENRIMLLIASGATAAVILWEMNLDIAVYYALSAVVAMSLSWYAAFNLDGWLELFYSFLMLVQGVLCLILVVDLTPAANDFLEGALELYGNMTYPLIILTGIAASDNVFTRLYRRYTSNTN